VKEHVLCRAFALHMRHAVKPALQFIDLLRISSAIGSVAEWLACWTRAQKGMGSNRSRDAVLGKLFTPIVPLFTKQRNW